MNSLEKNIKILVAYHKPSELINSDIFLPIHVGRSAALTKPLNENTKWMLDNMIGDDTGDNISEKNKTYCELTALYWAWKNLDADYVGLCHYRRFFTFKGKQAECHKLDNTLLKRFGLDNKTISKMCNLYDIILPPLYDTYPAGFPELIMTNYDFYCHAHYKADMDLMFDVISKYYPEYKQDASDYLNSKKSFFFNMSIMRRDLYDEYMAFLFGVMGRLESLIKISEDSYQSRVFGFLAERLQNVFIYHVLRVRPDVKVHYVENVLYYAPSCRPVKLKKKAINLGKQIYLSEQVNTQSNNINIVFSVDDNYAPHCLAAITSILLNSARGSSFNFYILDGGLSSATKEKFEAMKQLRDFNITYVHIDNKYFEDLPLNRSYISIATYYRLLLPEVLPHDVDKVIYLDSDVIVEQDIADLWKYDISDKYAAVVEDEGSTCQLLRLGLPAKNLYFNAGVCMFNLKALRAFDFQSAWKEYFKKNKEIITLQDQDILNGVFNGKCLYLPLQWNANGRLYSSKGLLEHSYSYEEAVFAAHNPAIIHYTDVNKPWHVFCTHPLRSEYFKYLAFTPYKNLGKKIKFKRAIKNIYFKESTDKHVKVKILGIKFNLNTKKLSAIK